MPSKWTQEQREKASGCVDVISNELRTKTYVGAVVETAIELACQRNELLEALTKITNEAESWHREHDPSGLVQCDSICDCLPAARAAIAKAESL